LFEFDALKLILSWSNFVFKESYVGKSLRMMYDKKKELNRTDSKADYKDVPRLNQV